MSALSRVERWLLALTAVLTALAGVADYSAWPAVPRFALATLALAGLAWIVSFATEQLGERVGAGATGLLQSTLGNLPELLVVVFALQKGELVVAQTAIVGSVFANALLVLGLVIVVGSHRSPDGVMRFSRRLPRDTATLLLLASFIIVLAGLSYAAQDRASAHIEEISIIGASALLVVYLAWVVPYVRTDMRAARERAAAVAAERQAVGGDPDDEPAGPVLGLPLTLALLVLGAVAAAFVSDWFINALAPAVSKLGLSQAFAGLVIVAIAANAVEHVVGVILAWRGQSDLAISVVKNSVAQIAAFLFPLLVLVSFALNTTLTFSLAPVYIGAFLLTALVLWQVTGDGEAAEFEGWALVAFYVILAAIALYE
jgi:Ca2+:H+ antiporter